MEEQRHPGAKSRKQTSHRNSNWKTQNYQDPSEISSLIFQMLCKRKVNPGMAHVLLSSRQGNPMTSELLSSQGFSRGKALLWVEIRQTQFSHPISRSIHVCLFIMCANLFQVLRFEPCLQLFGVQWVWGSNPAHIITSLLWCRKGSKLDSLICTWFDHSTKISWINCLFFPQWLFVQVVLQIESSFPAKASPEAKLYYELRSDKHNFLIPYQDQFMFVCSLCVQICSKSSVLSPVCSFLVYNGCEALTLLI